jgi:hypothetical protein
MQAATLIIGNDANHEASALRSAQFPIILKGKRFPS